jgi:glycosyltransferase involved in cell wall biosynthesis
VSADQLRVHSRSSRTLACSGSARAFGVGALSYRADSHGGLNRYTDALLSHLFALDPDLVAYVAGGAPVSWPSDRLRRIGFPILGQSNFSGNLSRFIFQQTVLPGLLRRDRIRVFYSPVPEGMLAPRVPQVVTIHDLLPLHFPNAYPRLKYYARYVIPRLVSASRALIVDSESTASDVREHYPVRRIPVYVIYPGYDDSVFRAVDPERAARVAARYRLERYILTVGETRPYKNLHRLIQAFAGVRERDLKLAVVGSTNRHNLSLTALPASLRIADRVRFLGLVPDEDLVSLYGGAVAFVFPSMYEGFGMPPLEAMACGCPVIASHAASIPEVCGDAAVYVDPMSTAEISQAIDRVSGDEPLRASLRLRGSSRVAAFSYRRTAEQVLDVLQRVGGSA